MMGKTKKATFSLHIDVLTALDEATAEGKAPSKNAFVEQALVKELNELKRQKRKTLWQEASKDQEFLNDITKVEEDFRYLDNESVEEIG